MKPAWCACALVFLPLCVLGLARMCGAVPSEPEVEPRTTGFGHVERLQSLENDNASGVVPKRVFNSKLRLVFAVGLEGAGHHYLVQSLDAMAVQTSEDNGLLRLNKCSMAPPYIVFNSMEMTPSDYTQARAKATRDMKSLALEAQGLPTLGSIATLQGAYTKDPQKPCYQVAMLSYPNFAGKNKVFQHVDLRMLAAIAEEEGVDFRVIYLKRSAEDMLISNMKHRHFSNLNIDHRIWKTQKERDMLYMRTLFTEAGVMHSLLAEVAPEFVVCHDYAKLGDVEQATRIAEFVSPNAQVAALLQRSLIETSRPSSAVAESLPHNGKDKVAKRLQQKLDVLESRFC